MVVLACNLPKNSEINVDRYMDGQNESVYIYFFFSFENLPKVLENIRCTIEGYIRVFEKGALR